MSLARPTKQEPATDPPGLGGWLGNVAEAQTDSKQQILGAPKDSSTAGPHAGDDSHIKTESCAPNTQAADNPQPT